MTEKRRISEAGTLAPARGEGVYRIRIISEGEGSTGVYSRALLENSTHVFANRLSFANHPKDPNKPWERGIDSIAGKTGPTVEYRVENGVAGLYTDLHVDKKWREFVEEYKDSIGVSVYADGSGIDRSDGKLIVESFDAENPYTSVDIVVAPGRGGGFVKMMEDYRSIAETSLPNEQGDSTATAEAETTKKAENTKMEEKLDKLIAVFEAFVAKQDAQIVAEQKTAEETETVEEKVSKAVESRVAALKAIDEASSELLPSQIAALRAKAGKGEDITDALVEAKAIRTEASKVLSESFGGGRTLGAGGDADFDPTVSRWQGVDA